MNRNIFRVNGALVIIFSLIASHTTSKLFGGHMIPASTPEAITDLSIILMALTGFVLWTIGQAMPKQISK